MLKQFKGNIILVLLTLVLALSVVGCAQTEKAEAKETPVADVSETTVEETEAENTEEGNTEKAYYPITYTTYNYAKEPVEVTIDKAPEKVVAVYQNSIETLLALGLEDKIVAAAGLDHKVKPELQSSFEKLEYLDDWQPTKETVVMLEPDFILSWFSYFGEKRIGDVGYYHENNIGTYMALNSGPVSPRTLANEYEDILTLGKIFNVNEKAEAIVNEMKDKVESVADKAKAEDEKKSALVIEFGGDKIRSYGAKSLGGDMVIQLGAELLSAEGNSLGVEDVIAYDADTIFVVYYNGGKRTDEEAEQGAIEAVYGNEAFANLKAVQNEKVIAIPLGELYASGIRTIDGIERMANGIYE